MKKISTERTAKLVVINESGFVESFETSEPKGLTYKPPESKKSEYSVDICPKCKAKVDSEDFYQHMAKFHSQDKERVSGQSSISILKHPSNLPEYVCTKCNRSFQSRFSLDAHYKELHPTSYPMHHSRSREKRIAQYLKDKVDQISEVPNDGFRLITCYQCGRKIPENILKLHMAEDEFLRKRARMIWQTYGKSDIARCPLCDIKMQGNLFIQHVNDRHPVFYEYLTEEISTSESVQIKHTEGASGKALIACPVCNANVNSSRLKKHILRVHPNNTKSASKAPTYEKLTGKSQGCVECPVCKVKIKSASRLDSHLRKVHPDASVPTLFDKLEKPTSKPRCQARSINNAKQNTMGEQHSGYLRESFYQSFDEPVDGSKGLGHMERDWDGKYGSYPLFDPSDDEFESE